MGDKVVLFGESAIDLLIRAYDDTHYSERVRGREYRLKCGGMGANQAVALRRLGTNVSIITRVGDDYFGERLLDNFRDLNLDEGTIQISSGNSAMAVISLNSLGEMRILSFSEGVNIHVSHNDLALFETQLAEARMVMIPLVFSLEIVSQALEMANDSTIITIVDPAHKSAFLKPSMLKFIDIITPNKKELSLLTGIEINSIDDLCIASSRLHDYGIQTVITTLGADGVLCSTTSETFLIHGHKMDVKDTVGAGDSFNAGFATGLMRGKNVREAIALGNATGALSTMGHGGQYEGVSLEAAEALASESIFENYYKA